MNQLIFWEAIKCFLPFLVVMGITFLLRKYFPGKLWLGMLLGFIFGPFGQFYLRGGLVYFVFWIILGYMIGYYFVQDLYLFILLSCLLSSAIMYFRFSRIKSVNR